MKRTILLYGLAILTLASCSKEELQHNQQPTSSTELSPLTPRQGEKSISLTLDLDASAIATGISTDNEARALEYDITSRNTPIINLGAGGQTEFPVHLFLRNEAGTAQFYSQITLYANNGRSSNGKIRLSPSKELANGADADNSIALRLVGSASTPEPKSGEKWYITGILGGGKLSTDRTKLSFSIEDDKDLPATQASAPYTFPWKEVTVTNDRISLSAAFKPQGTLFFIKVEGLKKVDGASVPMHLITDAVATAGEFDYSLSARREDNTTRPKWVATKQPAEKHSIRISRSLSTASDKATALIWAMPLEGKAAEELRVRPCIDGYVAQRVGTTSEHGLRTGALNQGTAYPITLRVVRPRIPLDFFAETNLNETRDGLAKTHSQFGDDINSRMEFMRQDSAKMLFPLWIDGTEWRLPTDNEIMGLGPHGIQMLTERDVLNQPEDLDFFNKQYTGLISNYRIQALPTSKHPRNKNILYGLRFSNEDNKLRVAYRHEFKVTDGDQFSHLEIRSVYVGADASITGVADIANEAYWDKHPEATQRIFPLAYYYTKADGIRKYGTAGDGGLLFDMHIQGTNYWQAHGGGGKEFGIYRKGGGQGFWMNIRPVNSTCCGLNDITIKGLPL